MVILIFVLVFSIGAAATAYLVWLKPRQSAVLRNTAASTDQPSPSPPPPVKPPEPKEPEVPPPPKHDVAIPPIENGLVPVISTLPTKQPVVFLGIDDGAHKRSFELDLMKRYNIKASLFLTYNVSGTIHRSSATLSQPALWWRTNVDTQLPLQAKLRKPKERDCGQADKMQELYGRRPIFLRPPGGYYNDETRRAAADCGMKALVMWVAKANGGEMEYQVGRRLRPGDIVLMHFRPEFKQDMEAFVQAMEASGLHTELLNDWLTL